MFGLSKFGVKVSENDGTMTLALQGIIETSTAEAFEIEMAAACSKSKNLIADFDKVNYISSAGLRVLLISQKKMIAEKGKMTLINLHDNVRSVLEDTGFTSILNIA
ncbi:STAS domain-containing protein [Fibrobacter sp.]|uniref:STAS domain-containing protein n=1 Tax=Fibrobacter sp. TaxID=35828 RepID=UPI002627D893|nr:STAS domain-containing protein [Fibrobacter sp.]MDD5941292.1 STAS domain-containing protein [Fibrobacter sp.]